MAMKGYWGTSRIFAILGCTAAMVLQNLMASEGDFCGAIAVTAKKLGFLFWATGFSLSPRRIIHKPSTKVSIEPQ